MNTIYVDGSGAAMTNRIFFINNAIAQLRTHGYLDEQTLQSLTRGELLFVQAEARNQN